MLFVVEADEEKWEKKWRQGRKKKLHSHVKRIALKFIFIFIYPRANSLTISHIISCGAHQKRTENSLAKKRNEKVRERENLNHEMMLMSSTWRAMSVGVWWQKEKSEMRKAHENAFHFPHNELSCKRFRFSAHSHTPSASKIPNNSQHGCEEKKSFSFFLFVHTIVDESHAKTFPVLSSIRLCRVVCVVSGKPMACRVESLSSYAMGIQQWLFSSRKQSALLTYTEWMWTWQNKVFLLLHPHSRLFQMLLACLFVVVFVFCRTWISCHDIKERESVRPHGALICVFLF